MRQIVSFFRGTIQVCITGIAPNQCINQFLHYGVMFYALGIQDSNCIVCTILQRDLSAANCAAAASQCQLKCLKKSGFTHCFRGLGRRPVLLGAMLFVLIGIALLPNFIWTLEVEGNETIPSEQILQQLEDIGIHFGTWIPAISNQQVKNKMLRRIPALQWLAVNCYGGKATVLVSERTQSEPVQRKYPVMNLIASRDGIISNVQVLNGFAQCTPGQAVRKGQLLISGYEDLGSRTIATRAMGEVYAQTQHKITAVLPSSVTEKTKSTRTSHIIWLQIGRYRIKIFGNSGISVDNCDKIESVKVLTLPGGYTLPFRITVQTLQYYTPSTVTLPEEVAWQTLTQGTKRQLQSSMIAGQLQSTATEQSQANGCYILSTTAWCNEMIARAETTALLTEETYAYGTSHKCRTY